VTPGLWQLLLDGLWITIQLTIGGAVLGLLFAFAAGLARLSDSRVLRGAAFVYTEAFRGLSALIVVFWLIFLVPQFGLQLLPVWAGILALALNIGAYGAEVVRGAVQSVPRSQLEAATALNFTPAQRMRKVILPQAFVAMIPPFSNNLIELLKATSLVSLVFIGDLTFAANIVRATLADTVLVYALLLAGYGALALLMTVGMRLLERRAAAALGRPAPPGMLRRLGLTGKPKVQPA
jgi:polar amino acid transport system permease protein